MCIEDCFVLCKVFIWTNAPKATMDSPKQPSFISSTVVEENALSEVSY